MKLTLTILEGNYAIHRLVPDAIVPDTIHQSRFYSVCRSAEELSIVCEADIDINALHSETGWRVMKIVGPLDFALTGILSAVAEVLAREKIPIFVLSTFDTDYILIRTDNLAQARRVLEGAGHRFVAA